MGEAVGSILIIVFGIPLVLAALVLWYFVVLFLGWIYIIIWLAHGAPIHDQFFNMFVLPAFGVYTATGLFFAFKPNLDGLSPGLKFIAHLIPAPLQRTPNGHVDLADLARRSKDRVLSPFTNIEKKFHSYRHQKAAEDLRVDANYNDAQAELHRAAQEYNRAKMRAEEAERAQRHGRR